MSDKKESLVTEDVINSYIWKGPKKISTDGTIEQTQKRLVDCSEKELSEYWEHCNRMLYNTDTKTPGRYVVKKDIYDQIVKCNAELFIRESIQKGTSRFTLLNLIRNQAMSKELHVNDLGQVQLKTIFPDVKIDYADIPIPIIIESCLDKSGLFTKKHLTISFILKQGLWLTPEELKEHESEIKNKSKTEKEDYFKKILNVNKKHILKINSSGLNLAALKEALSIKDTKYSQMSIEKLTLLRNYLLLVLLEDVENHIHQWKQMIKKIEQVMLFKNYKLIP